jgi:hypothetical protein
VITGYNTDVEHDAIVYHVQTEDTGAQSAEIISHVFVGGAILASKRTSYRDLLAHDPDEDVLRKRLERQHKLICAAVHAGRIEDLKQMSEREASLHPRPGTSAPATYETGSQKEHEETDDRVPDVEPAADEEGLVVHLLDEKELRGGQAVTLRLRVTRDGRNAVSGAPITVRTMGTSFAPETTQSVTDGHGIAVISLKLPEFEVGRAAILVQCEIDGELGELRRIILPANPPAHP